MPTSSPRGSHVSFFEKRPMVGDGEVRIWNLATGSLLHKLQNAQDIEVYQRWRRAFFSPNGAYLVTNNVEGSVHVYDFSNVDSNPS